MERRNNMEYLTNRMDMLSIAEIKAMRGIVPICANCRKIRDEKGFWKQIEKYASIHFNVQFSHGICPECRKRLYSEFSKN
jgi:hypothetical protein